jgi:hypothetical protein
MPTAIATTLAESGVAIGHVCGKITLADPAAAANISIGFIPSEIKIFNYTNPSQHNYYHGMTAAYMETQITNGTKSIVTAAGITEYAGDDTHAPGFTIGTNAVLNTAADVLYFTAFR